MANLYINDTVPKATVIDSTFHYSPNGKDLYIGRMENDEFPYWFNGVIDEIRIYNHVFSNKEAKLVYEDLDQ